MILKASLKGLEPDLTWSFGYTAYAVTSLNASQANPAELAR
jgi:hypothetical protein